MRQYSDRGIPVSINADDPKMFDTSLAEEFATLMQLHFSRKEIQAIIEQSVCSSWLSTEQKEELMAQFRNEFGSLNRTLM